MKNFTKSIVCSLLVFAMTAMSAEQSKAVEGLVLDLNTKLPVSGVKVEVKGKYFPTFTNAKGYYQLFTEKGDELLIFTHKEYRYHEERIENRVKISVSLQSHVLYKPEYVEMESDAEISEISLMSKPYNGKRRDKYLNKRSMSIPCPSFMVGGYYPYVEAANTESYSSISENEFKETVNSPLSTFSIDVDAASYSNVRRFLNNGNMPPVDAVRIEEMVNYFNYDYETPSSEHPFNVITEISDCPWNRNNKLVHIGLKGKEIAKDALPPSNLVFLIDVSGSMGAFNKLPLLKSAYQLLVESLREEDRVAIVVYAGAAGLVLKSTSGAKKNTILHAINKLQSGGSTAGGQGIALAYNIAKDNFIEGGNNRVILATDGDFNIGASSDASMERLIEEKRKDNIFLTVLGFGMGNYKDSKMETLADKGNGNYAYIDNLSEARKVLVTEFAGTLFTIAKDVKLQIEFNPAKVKAYKLVGYENRLLNDEDFNDDTKDAGELGAGHTVTALYEIVLHKSAYSQSVGSVDSLRYSQQKVLDDAKDSDELLYVKMRYKKPEGDVSYLLTKVVKDVNVSFEETSTNYRFAATVATFGMLLRKSKYVKDVTYEEVLQMAQSSKGEDREGYRAEFINMVRNSNILKTIN